MQTITVCTDAGHKNVYGQSVAAWACYIRTPKQTIYCSGIMKRPVKGSSHAELYAIANALHIVARDHNLTKYKLIVYSDNLYALKNHLDGTLTSQKPDRKKVYNKYIKNHIESAAVYEARHVKAHLPPEEWDRSSAKHYMQYWCDTEVHRIMKVAQKMAIDKVKAE